MAESKRVRGERFGACACSHHSNSTFMRQNRADAKVTVENPSCGRNSSCSFAHTTETSKHSPYSWICAAYAIIPSSSMRFLHNCEHQHSSFRNVKKKDGRFSVKLCFMAHFQGFSIS